VGDVESAAAFTNHVLWIDAAERPPLPADGDEWYVQDLVGAVAADAQGREVGEIVDVIVGGGGGGADLIRIALPPDPTDDDPSSILEPATVLLPFTKEFVPSVDAAGGRVVVAPPDGYLDAATKPRRAVGATGGKSLRPRKTRKARDAGARSQKAGGE
jgi:16S rRNA processing protein RimM